MATHAIAERFQDPRLRLLAAIVSEQQLIQAVPAEEWEPLMQLAHANNLLPMLYWAVRRKNHALTETLGWKQAREIIFASAVRSIGLKQSQLRIDAAFRVAAIPAIWLKGIALAHSVYPQPALRPMSDLDVLIPYDLRAKALQAAQAVGFDFYEFLQLGGVKEPDWEQSHHYNLKGTQGNMDALLEVHYHIINDLGDISLRRQERWFFEQIDDSHESLPMFKPEAFLLHLCAHALIHHKETETILSHYYDMHLLVTRKAIDWPLLVDRAVALRWSYAVEHALTLTRYLFETPIPEEVFAQLATRRSPDENVSRVVSLGGQGANWQTVLGMLRGRPFPQKIRLVRDFIFPARAYLQARYHLPQWVPIWLYYLWRWINQMGTILIWARERFLTRIL